MQINLAYTKVTFKQSRNLYGGFELGTDTLNSDVVGQTIPQKTIGEIVKAISFPDMTFKYLVKVELPNNLVGYIWMHHYEINGIR